MGLVQFKLKNPSPLLTLNDYRRAARKAVPDMVWAFVEGAAEDYVSYQRNTEAFRRWALRQRVLRGVGRHRRLSVQVAGEQLTTPVLLAPTGLAGLTHWRGEVAAAQAAERFGTREIVSNDASYTLAEVAAATQQRHWYQLYPWGNDKDYMRHMLEEARECGYRVLFISVDVPVAGGRETEQRRGMGYPPVLTPRRILNAAKYPRWVYGFVRHQRFSMPNIAQGKGVAAAARSVEKLYAQFEYQDLSWDDLDQIRCQWDGPLFVKGIMDPDDALRAVGLGVDGIVVSNHGGRQLDGTIGTLDALPGIVAATNGRLEVLLDGGVRRGSDVIKALCLGASAVLIGRPYLWGLAVKGADGVTGVLETLHSEIDRTMALMGCGNVDDLDSSWLIPIAPLRQPAAGPFDPPLAFGVVR